MFKAMLASACLMTVSMAFADEVKDPSMHDIYVATKAGRLDEAKEMIGRVLVHHPQSAKAHYTAAEVYARTCDREKARQEMLKAQTLEPRLKFVSQRSVRELQSVLAQPLPAKCASPV